MNLKKFLVVIGVVFIGIILAFFILRTDRASNGEGHDHGHADSHEEEDFERGSHGGRLLTSKEFDLEVTIFEKGIPPEFRLYAYENKKAIPPHDLSVTIELHRLGGRSDVIHFEKSGNHLRGDKEIEEPHSFDVKVSAEFKGKIYQWEYSQIEGRIELSSDSIQHSGIEILAAGPKTIKTILELPGEIVLNRDKVAHVVPRLSGVVKDVFKSLGDEVVKGELIAILESRELADLKSDYLASKKKLELVQAMFEREKNLWDKKVSAEQDYLSSRQVLAETEIEFQKAAQKLIALGLASSDLETISDKADLTRYEIKAPFKGSVIEKHITLGEAIKEDADIFQIADLSTLWGEITVYEKDLSVVRIGQEVTVKSKAMDLKAEGKIFYIGPLVGEETRTVKARVDITNSGLQWRPGLFVTVQIVQEEATVPVAISTEAIQTYRDWSIVFAQYGDFFEVRPLKLGRSDEKWAEVLEGVSAGEKYAARNSFVLKAELGKSGASHDH
jgi:cobalt-zinc-cadmium efflux system membrane fusion protein